MSKELFSFVGFIAFCLVMFGYSFKYELGLAKPKFVAGDCIRVSLSDEFHEDYMYYKILKVGKREYDVLWYNTSIVPGEGLALNDTGVSFGLIDREYEKTTCPSKFRCLEGSKSCGF